MNRTSNRRHKPKISDQTLDSQDSRCEDSKECSEESSEDDDDEDEDNSTDRDTEESEQGSAGKGREWEALAKYLRSQRAYLERNPPDSFHRMSGARKETKDKMTQKNLTSPMPSIWKPPVYKELSAAPNFKVIKSKEVKDKESEFEDIMLRYITKLQATNNAYKSDNKKSCPHKSSATERIMKLCSKHKKQAEHKPKRGRREDVHTCMDAAVTNIPQPEKIKNENSGGGMKIHSRCGLPIRCYREHLKREAENEETGKLREKLVYVVEEEGKGVAKMETDLISVNEILAIKQDLLELSEFAKKLKRLKEMKSESEKEKSSETECQCKPLSELLRDVNKRMEALEVRQEELERGIQKSREMETDTKKTDDTKMPSVSPPLGPVKPEPSAVKSVSSFGKSEMSREGGGAFSKNLEIVNELLDIKSQLQKLERKRMSKELSPEIGPAGFPKAKPKDQTINVFSSKTYILTSDAYKKKKNTETDPEEKPPNSIPSMKEKSTICMEGQQANDIVADWLKNISTPANLNSNLKVHAGPNNVVENEIKAEESWRMRSFSREKNSDRILEGEDFGNQEPQKNRAKDPGRYETNQISPNCSREIPSYLNRKEGRFVSEEFSWRDKLRGKISRDNTAERHPALLSYGPNQSFIKPRKTVSSGSVPSVVALREQLQRVKHLGKISNETNVVKPSRSKSAQEFTSASNLSKDEKMVLNTSRKNLEAKCARKREKENENELVQGEMSRFMRLNREIFPNSSRLVATVNLDERSTSLMNDRSRSPDYPLPLFPFPILPPEMFKIIECYENEEKDAKLNREDWCRRDDWDHKPKKEHREKDKVKACIKKCCKKKTRIKCSRNHCCNKKSRRAASLSSPSCGSCTSNKEAKKHRCRNHKRSKKDGRSKKTKKTCSCESIKSVEKKREEECKSKEKSRHEKKGKCKQPCCSNQKKREPSTCETSKTEEVYSQCQKKEELSTRKSSEEKRRHPKEKPKKSSLRYHKYCRPEQGRSFYDDSCYIASFWKSLRKLYPRFSALQLMSWLKLYCQEEKKTKQFQKKQKKETADCKSPREQHKKHESSGCQCCKSYRMSTFRQKWPGVSPSSKISGDNITEAETRSSVTTTETDFMFPYRNPKHYYAFKATQEEDEPEESKKSKKSKTRKKKEDKNNTTDDEGLETREKNCQCDRCGNIHSKKKKKKKVNYDKSSCNQEKETEYEPESKTKSKKLSKKGSKKSKKSIFSKLGDVRHLRVCERKLKCPKLNFPYCKTDSGRISKGSKCRCGARSTKKWDGSKKGGNCHCEAKLLELEDRIHNLEKSKKKKKQKQEEDMDEEHENKHKEKKKKKKEKNEPEYENMGSGSTEGCHYERKHKKREKKKYSEEDCHHEEKSQKKKKKKEKEIEEKSEKCECHGEGRKKKKKKKHKHSDSSGEGQMDTYYCDCLSKGFKTVEQSSAPKGTEASTPAPTEVPTQTPSEKSSFRQNFQRKKKEVLEKLSSLTSFWKNFRGKKKSTDTKTTETKMNDESFLLNDSSRSSEMPTKRSIRPVDEEPSLIGKLRKQKKQKKQKKDRKIKEKRVQKTKSKSRRHRFG